MTPWILFQAELEFQKEELEKRELQALVSFIMIEVFRTLVFHMTHMIWRNLSFKWYRYEVVHKEEILKVKEQVFEKRKIAFEGQTLFFIFLKVDSNHIRNGYGLKDELKLWVWKAACKTAQIEQERIRHNRTLSNNESIQNKNQVLENREIYLLEELNSQELALSTPHIWFGLYYVEKFYDAFTETCRIKNEKRTNCWIAKGKCRKG